MRIRHKLAGIAGLIAATSLAVVPSVAQADTYAYGSCNGRGYVAQTNSSGNTTVMWYNWAGNWGTLDPIIGGIPCSPTPPPHTGPVDHTPQNA